MPELLPFVAIPKHITTSEQLRRERPLLWKGVMMQGYCLDARRQALIGNELLNEIVAAAFLRPKKSLDLLQALQILTSS